MFFTTHLPLHDSNRAGASYQISLPGNGEDAKVLAGGFVSGVLAMSSGMAVGALLATAGGGTLILSIIILHYFLGLRHSVLFGTSAAITTVNALTVYGVSRKTLSGALKPAVWFTLPGLIGMGMSRIIPHVVSTPMRLALLGFLMVVNTVMSIILSKNQRTIPAFHPKRLAVVGCAIGIIVGDFGGAGGFLALPSMLISGLPQNLAMGSSTLTVAGFSLIATVRDIFHADIDWSVVILYIIGAWAGLFIVVRYFRCRSFSKLLHKMVTVSILVAGLFLLQRHWLSLYMPSIAIYDGIKGGLLHEFTD